MVFQSLFGGRTPSTQVDKLAFNLESFEVIDKAGQDVSSEEEGDSKSKSPYDWVPPHWLPNPMPEDFDIEKFPWERPEQEPMSFVGESSLILRGYSNADGGNRGPRH